MYKPDFPYLGDQVLISSGRVVIHSKDDFIFLFGKKGVSISSPTSFTVDANERTVIASPKIELGYQAETNGNQVLLGNKTVQQLGFLLDDLKALSDALSLMSAANLAIAIPAIQVASRVLSSKAITIKAQLQINCLSKTTYTN